MKLTIFILCCIIFSLQYNSANGQLNKFFGRVHESVQRPVKKITEDVKTLFNPNDNKKQEENNDVSTNIFFMEDDNTDTVRAEQSVQRVEGTTTSTTSTTTPQSAPKNGTTGDDKDGRENFSGGCLTGFMRTPDGRCKPTF